MCRTDVSDCSEKAALQRIRARADRGDANAMYNLGGMYDGGLGGVGKNQKVVREWYEKAALKGESRAAYNLACSCRDGEGGPVDLVLAAKWFKSSAESGHVPGACNYGIALARGYGVPQDFGEAERWLRASARAGYELAEQKIEELQMRRLLRGTPLFRI